MVGTTCASAAQIAGLYSTGVNSNGSLSTPGTVDAHYLLVAVPAGATSIAYIPSTAPTGPPYKHPWATNSTGQWLAPATNADLNEPEGVYDYRFVFKLADASGNFLDPSTVTVSGSWSVDDVAVIKLNGTTVATNNVASAWTNIVPFTISHGFQSGTNVLDFVVTNAVRNGTNATGLLVASLFGKGDVELPPTALAISMNSNSQVQLCWQTISNAWYQLQYRPSLETGQWLPFSSWLAGDQLELCTNDLILSQASRYYRLTLTNSPP